MQNHLDCLLIFPPFRFADGFYFKQRANDPPLHLLALAAYVRWHKYSVKILDCNTEFDSTDDEFEAYFISHFANTYSQIKVIGFTTTTPSINATFRISRICKKYFPEAKIVFGGAHASFVPDESLDKSFVDAVVMGEGEDSLKEILDGREFRDIPGLAYKTNVNGQTIFIRNEPRNRNKNLDELPMPAYDLIDIKKYRPILGNFKRLPAMMMVTSRGCPWPCNFCRRPVGRMWTHRSAQSLYDEMKHLSVTYGIKDIAIMDDVFTVNKQRVFELCDLLIQQPLDINWLCFARVDIVSEEMLCRMKQAGCWQIMYGVENFNQEVLNGISKNLEVSQIFEGVAWAKKAGLEVRVCMMVGNVGDTEQIIENNIKLLNQLDPDYISVAILTPFPGHDIYNWALERDMIGSYNWDDYYGSKPILMLDTLSNEDIKRLFRKMTFSFYFRPSFILKKFFKVRSLTELSMYVQGATGLLGFMTEGLLNAFGATKCAKRPVPAEFIEKKKMVALTKTATLQTAIS